MSDLTLEFIDELLADRKTRGEYKPIIAKFFDSEKLAIDLSAEFPKKDAQSLRNSIKVNLEKNFSARNWQVVLMGEKPNQHVVLINMDVRAAMEQAKQDQ